MGRHRVPEIFSKTAVRLKAIKTQVRSKLVSTGIVTEMFSKAEVR